jgi:hypothetical protein
MKKLTQLIKLSVVVLPVTFPLAAQARDDRFQFSLTEALATPSANAKIKPDIKLFWGNQQHETPTAELGTINARIGINNYKVSEQDSCTVSLVADVVELQKQAAEKGGNAIVDLHTMYHAENMTNPEQFVCAMGSTSAYVLLSGKVVKLP